uniref:Uncharacterized protein n=1 Tax=Anguilla anguilla TaxID=7936 RepID=A0A0E9PVY7_ANGAN
MNEYDPNWNKDYYMECGVHVGLCVVSVIPVLQFYHNEVYL